MTATDPDLAVEVAQVQDPQAPGPETAPAPMGSPLGNRATAALAARAAAGRPIPPQAAAAAVARLAGPAGNRATARMLARLAAPALMVGRQAVCDPSVTSCVNPDSADYKAGYRDATTTGVDHGVPRMGPALDDYNAGFAAGIARRSSPSPPAASVPAPAPVFTPNAGSADYKAGYDDATVGSGEPAAGSRTGQARADYDAGYAAGLKVAQQQGESHPAPAPADKTASLPLIDRVRKVVEYAGAVLGDEFIEQIEELLSPEALAVLAAFIAAQFVGLGEAADAVGIVMLAFKIGADAVTVAKDLAACFMKTYLATADADLREAGQRLAHAISLAGVDVLLVYIAAKGSEGKAAEGEGKGKGAGEGKGRAAGEGEGEGARRAGKEGEGKGKAAEESPLRTVDEIVEGVTKDDVHIEDELPPQRLDDGTPDFEMTPEICFPADTPVHTPDGPRPIQALAEGDVVLAWDEASDTVAPRAVTAVIRGATGTWIDVELDGEAPLRSTPTHPVWVVSLQAWTTAADLTAGMTVRLLDGRTARIRRVTRVPVADAPTFNLSVAELDTFFAGAAGVLVHNAKMLASRFRYLNRPGYFNYVLRNGGPQGEIYYSGMFGTKGKTATTAADVVARHAKTGEGEGRRFRPGVDAIEVDPTERTYAEARIREDDVAVEKKTIRGRDGENFRCNRQRPLAESKSQEYRVTYETFKGKCG